MKELKPSTKLDGTPEENERAIQRIIDSLTEEEITEAMSDKYAYLDEDLKHIFRRAFLYARKIRIFVIIQSFHLFHDLQN